MPACKAPAEFPGIPYTTARFFVIICTFLTSVEVVLLEKRKRRRRLVLFVLLAVLCIGGAELAACRVMEPELFQEIVRPAVWLAEQAKELGGRALRGLETLAAGAWDGLRSIGTQVAAHVAPAEPEPEEPAEDPPENQLVSEPTVASDLPIEDPKVTEFSTYANHEILTGGPVDVYYFHQGEEPWASSRYGPDPIAGYGCGPTAMAMVVSTLTDLFVNPADMAQWAYEAGYCCPGSGSYHSIVQGTAEAFGLEAESWQKFTAEELCRDLALGYIFVALMGPGHFTANGHFILLRGITLEGKVLVADPNSRDRSLMAWEPQLLLDELSSSRTNGAPLWRISTLPQEP